MKHLLVKKCGNDSDGWFIDIYIDDEYFMSVLDFYNCATTIDTIEQTLRFLKIEYMTSIVDINCKYSL